MQCSFDFLYDICVLYTAFVFNYTVHCQEHYNEVVNPFAPQCAKSKYAEGESILLASYMSGI